MAIVLEGNTDYIIFFDDQHIQRFVTSFTVTTSVNSSVGEAVIECVYAKALMDVPYMTDVKVFVRNIFSGRYKMVFDGQIHTRQVTMSAGSRQITFIAYDYMYWLQKLPVPFVLGLEQGKLDNNVTLAWQAQGINTHQVRTVMTSGQLAFAGRDMRETIKQIFLYIDQALTYSPDYNQTEHNSIYKWVDIKEKIRVLSDFDPRIRDDSLIDLFYQGSIIQNLFVLINGITSSIGYEFYQDVDGIIKIKEPFWYDGIIKPFVIDPNLILDFNETTTWDNKPTRVLATGGLEENYQQHIGDSSIELDIQLPSVLYIHNDGGGIFINDDQAFPPETSPDIENFVKDHGDMSEDEAAVREAVVRCAYRYQHQPYIIGGGHPGNDFCNYGLDCSGFVYVAYRDAGLSLPSADTFTYYRMFPQIPASALRPGDIAFSSFEAKGPGHMGMYVGRDAQGKYVFLSANGNRKRPGDPGNPTYPQKVVERKWDYPTQAWDTFASPIPRLKAGLTDYTTIFELPQGRQFISDTTSLTEEEKKYGINLVEAVQNFIKIQFTGNTFPRSEAYRVLGQYAKYLHTALTAASTVASLTTISAPWLRPGFNVWVDPTGISRVYYINSVRHSGSNGMVYTNLGLVYGRSEPEFKNGYIANQGKTTSPLTTAVLATSKDFYLEAGSGASALNYVTPDNMDAFKEYVSKVHAASENKGSIPAHLSVFKDWYGESFIRRNTHALSRWDSDFNLFELYCIIAASYGVQNVKDLQALQNAPTVGSVNETNVNSRYVSDFARYVIDYDIQKAGVNGANVPDVIKKRAAKMATIVTEADREIGQMYVNININKDYTR